MTRLLFYTDLQLSGKTPRHRVDDYQGALISKLEEVYDIARGEQCAFVVFGGDFFNGHRMYRYDMLNRSMDAICDSGLDTYAIIGQHDIKGYNAETFQTSTLAFMDHHCEAFHVLWEPAVVGDVKLWPSHVWDDLDTSKKDQMDPDKINVLVAHHLLTKKSLPYNAHMTSDFAVGCPFSVVMSGDLHSGFDPHEHDGVWFVNPGSLARQSIDEVGRMPRVAIVDLYPKREPKILYSPLRCAGKGEDVFGESAAEVARSGIDKDDFDPSAVVEGLEQLEAESVDVHDLVQKVGQQKQIRPEVLAYLDAKR